jgi:hypothetical protein
MSCLFDDEAVTEVYGAPNGLLAPVAKIAFGACAGIAVNGAEASAMVEPLPRAGRSGIGASRPLRARSGDRLLSEPSADTQPWRRQLVFMPLFGPLEHSSARCDEGSQTVSGPPSMTRRAGAVAASGTLKADTG